MKLSDLTTYEIIEEKNLSDIHSQGTVLRHKKSGAKVAVISNDDENKVFYIGFRTPAGDSTGVPHIIEHSVLCGSDQFPVKDPFVELVKGSLNTFLNAMTYPDKTVYPVASCNDKDFQNLMHVYLDAVLHPNIYKKEEIFKQEGWHYELESEENPLTLNGVVYNEMKGAFSSPEGVLERVTLNSLFPDTTYANESGGDPACIPDLTYEAFLDFHRRYYHPCNAYLYLYGDMDAAEKLDWIDQEYLSLYEQIPLDSSIKFQQPFDQPVTVKKNYPIANSEPEADNAYLSYNVAVATALEPELCLAFDILDYALLNAPGAPLRQALLDAKIGKDVIGGYDSSIYQPMFTVTAKNANACDQEKFVRTIEDTLRNLVKNGMIKKALRAGINSNEFKFREADFGAYPKGLIYGLQCLDSWLYDDQAPFLHLEALGRFQFLKEQVDNGYFERLIQKYFLDNTHKSFVRIEPQKGLNEKKEQELAKKLSAYKSSLNKEEIRRLVADTAHLKAYQQEPSAQEDLEKIPMLKREDMKRECAPLYNEEKEAAGIPVVHHAIETNGINYVSFLFDLSDIKQEWVPYLGVLRAVLADMDTEDYTYEDLANEINLHTGGISASILAMADEADPKTLIRKYEIRTKALHDETGTALRLIASILCRTKLEDDKRLYEVIAQAKSRLEMQFMQAGHTVSALRAMSYFSPAAQYNDLCAGIGLYRVVADAEQNFDDRKEELKTILAQLFRRIFRPDRLIIGLTGNAQGYAAFASKLEELKQNLFAPDGQGQKEDIPIVCTKKNEGFKDASQVQYVSRAGNFSRHGYAYTGALRILKVIMNYDYLWLNIRVKGGAYGCMSGFTRTGDAYFCTYRDPNLRKSNEVFEGMPDYLQNFQADERTMTKYMIGTVSDLDTPLNPSAKGYRSMMAYLNHITQADIQKERDEVLQAGPQEIRALAPLIASVLSDQNLCVIGNETMLEKEASMFDAVEDLF
ncbi:MAG: insulinase family protein [Eubacterium sp.]|nr:insulinase family protein [Eubacterium sp.]